ncbi:PadR family transcriptional regulator [Bacillus sp. HBCD-sjtu]|nr:PadR family transcriptional regulator [Bacillus sp. HBCD-sjtu]
MSKRRYMKIIADIIGITVDIFEKSLIYLGRYRVEYTRAEI